MVRETVSVIVPTTGRPELIRALDSVARQDLDAAIEVIVVVDVADMPDVINRLPDGLAVTVVSTVSDMALVRYKPDGTLDASFDGDGKLTADFHGRGEFGQNLALDSIGRIVAAGYTANGGNTDFALMRANP